MRLPGQPGLAALLLLVLSLAAVAATPLAALDFPPLTGRVVDQAGLLDDFHERRLIEQLKSHEEATSNQVVVVTLTSLQGTTIEDFGYQLGRHWGIGQEGRDNGVLLIVARQERKVRIEVGYGLEGDLPDALAKTIIDYDILPAFRANDFPRGISAGVEAIILAIEGAYDPQERRKFSGPPLPILFIIIAFVIVFIFLQVYFFDDLGTGRRHRSSRRRGRRDDDIGIGFGSGGSSGGFGGFGGGGGDFGGGGASGDW